MRECYFTTKDWSIFFKRENQDFWIYLYCLGSIYYCRISMSAFLMGAFWSKNSVTVLWIIPASEVVVAAVSLLYGLLSRSVADIGNIALFDGGRLSTIGLNLIPGSWLAIPGARYKIGWLCIIYCLSGICEDMQRKPMWISRGFVPLGIHISVCLGYL